MANALAGTLDNRWSLSLDLVRDLGLKTQGPLSLQRRQSYTNGNGVDKADTIIGDDRSAATPDTIQLRNTGVLKDTLDSLVELAKIKEILIINLSKVASEILTLTGNWIEVALGVTTGGLIVDPGGFQHFSSPSDGYDVTATTADQIIVTSSAGDGLYQLLIVGEVV